VLYILELWRILLSLVHIWQQGQSVHILDGKVEIRKDFQQHGHHDRGGRWKIVEVERDIFSYSLLWHAIFCHINYDNLHLLKKNGVSGFPTIPMNLNKCDTLVSLEIIENNIFMIPLLEHVENLDWYILICVAPCMFHLVMAIDISWILLLITLGCVRCILKLLKNFMYGSKMKPNIIFDLFILIMEENIHKLNLKSTSSNMGSSIKLMFHTILNRMV